MAQPYIGEIRQFGGNFAPAGWMLCQGQILPISEYDTLFNLIGTTYGGDGQETFALPDLQGRVPIHMGTQQGGSTYVIGQKAGTETVTLNLNQIPSHTHLPTASTTGGSDRPQSAVWGASPTGIPYAEAPGTVKLNPASIGATGGSQPHDNMHPFLAVSFIISLYGIYPSQS